MISSFVLEHLRQNLLHTCVKSFATALEASVLLSLVGINRGIGPNPTIQRLNFGIFVSILLLCAFAICFLFMTVARYAEVLEMDQEIGVLRILGASTGFILYLLFQDTLVVTILGTGIGIIMTFGVQWFVGIVFAHYLTQETAFDWWPLAVAIAAMGPLVGAAFALPRSSRQGVKEALSATE